MKSERFDFVVIGSGLAGLTYALKAAERGSVAVLTKSEITDANTSYAQGGIAAAIGEADSWKLHEQDTLIAGAGLCDPEAVRFLVQNAEGAIDWLLSLGTHFDTSNSGDIALGREGGHSRNRIVHHMDRTGWEVERAVSEAVAATPNIRIFEHAFATGLITAEGKCIGVNAVLEGLGERAFFANAVMLATGGCGKLYQHTTNPAVATADGIGLAFRAGAVIQNMEFMQFHPTTLYHPQMRSFLITEAARGAGATLRNHLGERFMYDYDERLELAPRDVVARAMEAEMKKLNTWCLYLDLAHLPKEEIKHEFPTIYERLQTIGLEIYKDWIPVVPAQHYSCGGVKTDLEGRTSIEGLFAAGEVACTGVHGANRLASNSLLEAMVFARSAGEAELTSSSGAAPTHPPTKTIPEEDSVRIRRSLQKTMTDKVAIVRTNVGLAEAQHTVSKLLVEYARLPKVAFSPHPAETLNLLQAAECVISGAIARRESVGLHYNTDLPNAALLNKAEEGRSPEAKAQV
ncbi:MAG TPA: L-aspartate oxidase [Fimbriimonadaceae bacterium]|jgi:L-aspartate oxidase